MIAEKLVNIVISSEDDLNDEEYDFLGEVLDPPTSWNIVSKSPRMSKSVLVITIPENDVLYGGDEEHIIKFNINCKFYDDDPEFIVKSIYFDNVKCDMDAFDEDTLSEFVYNMYDNGWFEEY